MGTSAKYAKRTRMLAVIPWLLVSLTANGGVLDRNETADPWLELIASGLDSRDIDVAYNLNGRGLPRLPQRPTLGALADLPAGQLPLSDELDAWEEGFTSTAIGAVAVIAVPDSLVSLATPPVTVSDGYQTFWQRWRHQSAQHRIFVSFAEEDLATAGALSTTLRAMGFESMVFFGDGVQARPGRLFTTAGRRLVIDSRAARSHEIAVAEFRYLGERVRRNSNSVFRDGAAVETAAGEPQAFIKETLGDEHTASTIEEIIVPGGIALGETAELPWRPQELIFEDDQLRLLDQQGQHWRLPAADYSEVKALYDFVQRSEAAESDAIVDIDAQGRVRISAALRDTDAGYQFVQVDAEPFNYLGNARSLDVSKSVIIDRRVNFEEAAEQQLSFNSEYEVRFLSADNMRIAQTRIALEYDYSGQAGTAVHDYTWGRESGRLDENLDYAGLGNSTAPIGPYAAWIALFRALEEDRTPFLTGRYEFMKIIKAGRPTPHRY
ncbi:MAG: hypothetical protein WDZ76_00840 [Pseudohongiellaceae bacterium]